MMMPRRTVLFAAATALLAAGAGTAMFMRQAQASVETGAAAPNFSVHDATGATRTLSEFRGRTVVLEWTNEGCPFVRRHYDFGDMQALQQEATAQGVVWLQVISSAPGEQGYLDGAGALARVQADNAHPTATLLDPNGVMGHAYGARNTPHMFVIDGDGRLVYQGAIDNDRSGRHAPVNASHNYVREALADVHAGRAVAVSQTMPYGCAVKYRG